MGVDLSPAQLRDYIRTNTDLIGNAVYDINTGKNLEFGYGRLNAASAVAHLGGPEISVVTTTIEILENDSLHIARRLSTSTSTIRSACATKVHRPWT